MTYKEYSIRKKELQLQENLMFPKKVWEAVSKGKVYDERDKYNTTGLRYYKSIFKKIEKFSEDFRKSPQKLCEELNNLEGIGLEMALNYWVVNPGRQNLSETWKIDYLSENTDLEIRQKDKSGPQSVYLNSDFRFIPKIVKRNSEKNLSDEASNMKTFDFEICGMGVNTLGFDGLLTIDKTTKEEGGGQKNVMKEVQSTILHLNNDPEQRKFGVILDGDYWNHYRNQIRGKYKNILVFTSDDLRELYPKK